MTRFEVNFLLLLACFVAAMVSRSIPSVLFLGALSVFFGLRAALPKLDRFLLTESDGERRDG